MHCTLLYKHFTPLGQCALVLHVLQHALTMPWFNAMNQCHSWFNAIHVSMPFMIQCHSWFNAIHVSMPFMIQCHSWFNAIHDSMPFMIQCHPWFNAIHDSMPFMIQPNALTMPWSTSALQAILNIARSLFIIAVLASFHWFLSRDSRTLVLDPIERMVASVSELAANPLAHQVWQHNSCGSIAWPWRWHSG